MIFLEFSQLANQICKEDSVFEKKIILVFIMNNYIHSWFWQKLDNCKLDNCNPLVIYLLLLNVQTLGETSGFLKKVINDRKAFWRRFLLQNASGFYIQSWTYEVGSVTGWSNLWGQFVHEFLFPSDLGVQPFCGGGVPPCPSRGWVVEARLWFDWGSAV